jgi:hypothetical protein
MTTRYFRRYSKSKYAALGLVALVGCSRGDYAAKESALAVAMPQAVAPRTPTTRASGPTPAAPTAELTAASNKPESPNLKAPQRLLIYTATLQVSVPKPDDALHFCQEVALKRGGYVLSRNGSTVQIRVPSATCFDAIGEIEKLGKVSKHDIRAEDVSEQFRDLELRLKNAHAVRERISQLLNRGVNIKDALTIESELSRLSEEIEVMEGQLRRMKELTSYSTISASFAAQELVKAAEVKATPVNLPFAWLDRLSVQKLMEVKL